MASRSGDPETKLKTLSIGAQNFYQTQKTANLYNLPFRGYGIFRPWKFFVKKVTLKNYKV